MATTKIKVRLTPKLTSKSRAHPVPARPQDETAALVTAS
jgi:hypothetical protein